MANGSNGQPDEGEAQLISSVADAAMHMFGASIDALPEPDSDEYAAKAAVVLTGLRKLETALAQAASRSRVTPTVIVSLAEVRNAYDALMVQAANSPSATLGQQLYLARREARLSVQETANGAGLRADLLQAVEAEEELSGDEASKVKELIGALAR
jgi:hypothetical protein